MLNEKNIYNHLKNGGSIEDLEKALVNEINAAQDRIIKEKDAELKEKELAAKINKARTAAIKALKSYFALVNPTVDDKMINIALDTLESTKIVKKEGEIDKDRLLEFLFPLWF